jgi:hypothetical protein
MSNHWDRLVSTFPNKTIIIPPKRIHDFSISSPIEEDIKNILIKYIGIAYEHILSSLLFLI